MFRNAKCDRTEKDVFALKYSEKSAAVLLKSVDNGECIIYNINILNIMGKYYTNRL